MSTLLAVMCLILLTSAQSAPSLNLTAITTAPSGISIFECWQLTPFETSAVAGTAGALSLDLGDLGENGSFTVIPGGFDGGLHRAPLNQFVLSFLVSLVSVPRVLKFF